MNYSGKFLNDYYSCHERITNSNFENFLGYKNLFKLVYEASENLCIDEFKELCKAMGITFAQAKSYYAVYDKLFNPTIGEYKISDELAKRAKNWDMSIWIEFSRLYTDDLACRKVLFYTLITNKLKYSNVCLPIDKLRLSDVKKYRQYINKFKPNKPKNVSSKFKGLKTRLQNFISKDFKSYTKADKELMEKIKDYHTNLIALVEEHLESSETEKMPDVLETEEITEQEICVAEPVIEKAEIIDQWQKEIERFTDTDLYKMYSTGRKMNVNWENPYYAVIFLGIDIFNLPSREEYRRKYRELILLFHPDKRNDENKETANTLLTILNDLNLSIWGINGERYDKFITHIKFSLIKLGV